MPAITNIQANDSIDLMDFTDLMVVFDEVSREKMQGYVEGCLGKLIAGESQNRKMLLLTLETYVKCDGQINVMSSQLYIHRNTATYRIEKLEGLLGMPLKTTNNLLRLKLAFLFLQLLANTEQPGA